MGVNNVMVDGSLSNVGGGGNMSMPRSSHPPLSGGPVPIVTATPVLTPSLPTAKPTASSYQVGTKFHVSHSTNNTIGEAQYGSSSGSSSHTTKGGSQESDAQTTLETTSAVQFTRHRIHRRTKDQETNSKANNSNQQPSSNRDSAPASNTQHNRGIQFDLEASAFPPLPGLDADHNKSHNPTTETIANECSQSQNRLADVVKGTAKIKSTKEKESGIAQQFNQQQHHVHHHHHQISNSSRSASPGSSNPIATTVVTITAVPPIASSTGGGHGSTQENAGQSNSSSVSGTAPSLNSNTSASSAEVTDNALSTITPLSPPSSPDK